ncbi:hypothetical protein ACR777_08105 [Sphingobacterium spiritivorum]|uniref:hypothetical protein n=1 Tax=Sphingobacterium spiritivorum TaxID=258 RepID=UPI003DA60504
MKRFLPILLMAIMLIQSFNRVWIVSSFYINQEYIAVNLCVNRFDKVATCKGSCVLKERLKKEKESEQQAAKQKISDVYAFFQLKSSLQQKKVINPDRERTFPPFTSDLLPTGNPSSIFHPPVFLA